MEGAGTGAWKPLAWEGRARQGCPAKLEMVGTKSVVGEYGEKCRDRKEMTRLHRGGLRGKAAAKRIKRFLFMSMHGIDILGCTVADASDTNWEGGGRCRRSLGGGSGTFPAFVGLGTNVHGWS